MAKRLPKLEWNKHRYMQTQLIPHLERGMNKAAAFAEGEAKKLINRGQPTIAGASGKRRGLSPSKPGEAPKKVTARLQQSTTHRVTRLGLRIIGFIGATAKYARALEKGIHKKVKHPAHSRVIRMAWGKPIKPKRIHVRSHFVNMNMAARPFLIRAIRENKARIRALILGG